jgi:hypothetical protein
MAKVFVGLLLVSVVAFAQPPDPQTEDTHILGILPNYNTTNMGHFDPITVKEKFKIATLDTFDPFSWVVTGLYAGVAQWQNDYRGFGQGATGYAKRYGAAFSDQAIGGYLVEGVLPALLHEDPRYFRLGRGGAWKRAGYAVSRVLVTRTDSGAWRFNTSEVAGNMIAASLANLYYPASDRTAGETIEKFSISMVNDAGFNVLKEFWPDMKHKLLHR